MVTINTNVRVQWNLIASGRLTLCKLREIAIYFGRLVSVCLAQMSIFVK